MVLLYFEPQHDKTNKMTCAPSEDLDQPGHPPDLIRVFAVRFIGSRRTAKTLIRSGGCLGWSESSLAAQATLIWWFCHAAAPLLFLHRYLVIVAINFTNFGTIVVYLLLAAQNIELLLHSFMDISFCYISIIVAGLVLPITWLGSPKEFW